MKMKKALAICLTLVMMLSMSIPAFAALGGFWSSPSGVVAPKLEEYENDDHDCTAELIITAYADRHTLPDDVRAKLEKAYNDIVNTNDVTSLNADLAALAKEMNVPGDNLAVIDLFDISYYSCEHHGDHGGFTITIRPESLKNFVGIMHLNGDSWELLENAEVDESGDLLTFYVEDLSPFAIVVNTDASAPPTGDFSNVGFYVALMAVSAAALVVIGFQIKKRATN